MVTHVALLLFTMHPIIHAGGAPRLQQSAAPASVDAARIPVSMLKSARPQGGGLGPKGEHGNGKTRRHTGGVPGVDSLINFTDQFEANGFDADGNPQTVWPYEMVGRAPDDHSTTAISAPIIPVVLDLLAADGTIATFQGHPLSFDPTDRVQPVVRSPMFQPFQYSTGFTQFNDAMMRAQFWNRFHHGHGDDGGGYHVLLTPTVKATRHMRVPFGKWRFFTDANNLPEGALVDFNTFASLLFPATSPVDATTPIGAAELAGDMTTRDLTTLLFDNVFLFDGTPDNCCTLGFHSYDLEPGDAKNGNRERRFVMDFASWIDPNLFSFGFEDIAALSHEIAETFNDPFVDDATPWWLSLDPFTGAALCQNNLESGDVVEVLSSNPVFAIQMNGRTYHPSNEALLPWFAFESSSTAKDGAYSFPDETTILSLSPGPLLPGCVPTS